MNKLIVTVVLILGVSGAAGAPVWSADSIVAGTGGTSGQVVDRVRLRASGGNAEMVLLRLGVDPARIERDAHWVSAPLTPGQRASLARLDNIHLR